MLLMPSFFRSPCLKQLLRSWWKPGRQVRSRKQENNQFGLLGAEVLCLENRVMLSAPTVNLTTNAVAANATAITITGTNFDPTTANDAVTITDVTNPGTIITASPTAVNNSGTSMNVSFISVVGPLTANDVLDAVVTTTGGGSSVTPVEVGVVIPAVDFNAGPLPANATSVVITGAGFDAAGTNLVNIYENGSISLTGVSATSVSATSLTVSLAGIGNIAGGEVLSAVVTTDGQASGSKPGTQVATVAPVITPSGALLAANAPSLTIHGAGFDFGAGTNFVNLYDNGNLVLSGASGTFVTYTSLTISLAGIGTVTGGDTLDAVVTTDGEASGSAPGIQVATVTPAVTKSTANLSANATSLGITGAGFDAAGTNLVDIYDNGNLVLSGVSGTSVSSTSMTVSLAGIGQLTGGDVLKAVVTTDGEASGSAPGTQVATVASVVTMSASPLLANATTLTISGVGFDPTSLLNNSVALTDVNNNPVTNSVFSVAPDGSSMVLTLTGQLTGGTLSAVVSTSGVQSGTPAGTPVQVATVTPVVTLNGTALTAGQTSLTINGFGFDPTLLSNNSVALTDVNNNPVTNTVFSVAPDGKSMVLTLTGQLTGGALSAVVTTNTVNSGAAVEVANVTPVVTSSASPLAATATTLTINGFGFDPTLLANNSVALTDVNNNPVTNTIFSIAPDGKSLVVTLTSPLTGGTLFAVVTTNGSQSGTPAGTPVAVATVTPVVTLSAAPLLANATTLTINGVGFNPSTPVDHNSVVLTDVNNFAVAATITGYTATSLTLNVTGTLTGGPLYALVTTNGVDSGLAPGTQVATVTPVVTMNTTALPANATTLTIAGFGFDTLPANDVVTFTDVENHTFTAPVIALGLSANSLTVDLSGSTLTAGPLSAAVTVNGVSSGTPIQVATVTPVVTSSPLNLALNGTCFHINGFGFDPIGTNTVVFDDGVVGTVTAVTPHTLDVTLTTPPTALGILNAVVTTNGQVSGTPPGTQVATVIPAIPVPTVTKNTNPLAANLFTLTINGTGFDATANGDNYLTFNDGAVGTVTTATATSLTVTFSTRPVTAGILTAEVCTDGVMSATPVQVAFVTPVVTFSAASQAVNATTVTIHGFGFDPTPANNKVVFNDGAVGTVTTATPTSLLVTFSTEPAAAGILTAVVTTNNQISGLPVQVATLVPVVTASAANLAANAGTLTINGFGFDPTIAHDLVVFNDGAVGTVTFATTTSMVVTFSTKPVTAGNLTATVTIDGVSNGSMVQVATVTPVVTKGVVPPSLPANATSVVIMGFGFDPTLAHNLVTFNDGAVGTVSVASPTSLTVTFTTNPASVGNLTAVVTTNGVSSGLPVLVATVTPVVTTSALPLAANATSIVINGFGFDPTAANNKVFFNDGAVGTVTTASATSLTVTFSTKPATAGSLTAIVVTDNVSSGPAVQVATVTPVVTLNTASLAASANSIIIKGFGFDPIPGNNIVSFNNAAGTVTAATSTSLTVTFTTKPTVVGSLTASVTTDGVNSGAAVQVASVTPGVIANLANLPANAATIVISGFGFDPTNIAVNNIVLFNDGALGTVTGFTAPVGLTPGTITVTFSAKPATAGSLTAHVITDGVDSGAPVQVATVTPVVTASAANLAANAPTITIAGFGFDPTAAHNVVTFTDGAVGTVTTASTTSLTVTFSTMPTTAGILDAVVTTNGAPSGVAPGSQVATITPVVTMSTAILGANATTITINGFGFDPTAPVATHNTVVFNHGTGTVTAATATSLTVTFNTLPTTLGSLTAMVTTDGISSGAAVQVATVGPVVTSSVANLAANAGGIVIHGFGFDTTPGNNLVTFNDGAVGTVVGPATATTLNVTFSIKPATAGPLTVVVTTDTVSSGSPVQVATVTPVVTASAANLAANAPTITIAGFGFDPTAAHNVVTFTDGAVGTVTTASTTSLTVTFSTKPTTAGILDAVVTTNGAPSGVAPGSQVATITPVVTMSTAILGANATTITINGFGFDPTAPVATHNTVVFNHGTGTVTAATATSLTVTFNTLPTTLGSLTAMVTTDGISSGAAVQVATVAPVVTSSVANLPANAGGIVIHGFGFDTTPGNNLVTFNDGAVGTVVGPATATTLNVTFSIKPATAGPLTVVVTTDTVSSGSPVQVATVIPVVALNTANLPASSTSIVINGFGFDPTPAHNTVVFTNGAVGTVTTSTATSLTVTFSTKPTTLGSMTAVVTTNGVGSGAAVQVATITPAVIVPVVTSSIANLPANATTITINGTGFDPVAAHDTVTFNDGAVGSVTTASATSLTVTFSIKPATAGSLTAVVTTLSANSGAPVQVATVTPVVTPNSTALPANPATIVINGFGFDPIAAHNTVVFNAGAVGTVTTASPTSLTVTFSTKPLTTNSLTAVVTTNGVSSGATVQVASVVATVTMSTASLNANAGTLTISGTGFNPVIANDTVVFNDGAVGTVTFATTTSLNVTFSTKPVTAGVLTAIVTVNGVSSGPAVQVATVVPVVTKGPTPPALAANATSVVIMGFGFDPVMAHNTVVFNDGAVGTVSAATATSLTVTLSTKPTAVGNLTAVVTTNGVSSGAPVLIASVVPVVTPNSANLSHTATTITITGFGFDLTPGNNKVFFSNGAVGIVTASTATSLTITFTTKPTTLGSMTAHVITDGIDSGVAVQVATVI